MTDTKRKPGRPTLPADKRMLVVTVRITGKQKLKLKRIGVQRLRDWLERAKE